MFCTKCGAKLPDGARFCAMCGAPATMPETPSTPVAPASAPQPTSAPGSQPVAAATPAPVAAPVAAPAPAPVPAAASQPAPVAAGGLLNPFVQQVATRLGEPAQFIPELQTYLFVTKRFSAALANIHQYFLIYENNGVGYNEMRDYSAACTDWALHNYAGVPRGLQKGVAIYPVMLQHPMNPGAIQFVKEKPKAKFAAFTLPVVVDPIDRQVQFMDTTPVWGFAMWGGVKKAATEVLS
ncbi:zinc ribbon domain-containing protein [[Collinsella] massiliensis]|uniref:Zinc-ribbon domain-containing protein n=1 Tax=[Collinsella] massiliensis TaxID=1232426 RepID=A0A1Y3Y4W2_9ACTN|nr:zinc ribbon domain-containing protein [[Collinsella] massiliensis]OUN89340.1 hypothetical protein B5G02_02350 [[Collinsella] massiliensis]